jgi:hypothetical protein
MSYRLKQGSSDIMLPVCAQACAVRIWPAVLNLCVAVIFLCSAAFASASTVSEEYQIKAAFIPNFVRFVSWPDAKNLSRPFVFKVLGKNPFGNALEPANRQKFKGGIGVVKYVDQWERNADDVQVMFISRSMRSHLREILWASKGVPVLTISDIGGFARAGGMIEFTEHDGSIHFIINLNAVRESGLDMNFQLLQLADSVIGK